MSTLKSSAEDLTLNADGSGNDIKFQSNAVEKASLSDAGLLTTSGGASLDGAVTINESGADVDFRIEDVGGTHAFFLQGSEGRIGINHSTPDARLEIHPENETGLQVESSVAGETTAIFKGASTSAVDVLRVDNSAEKVFTVEQNGEVTVSIGDIVFGTAGKGIVLGATSNTDANTLDDYEEGSWTPAMTGYSGTINVQAGTYVIIGGMCFFSLQLGFNGSDNSIVQITLPVTSKNLGTPAGGGYMTYNAYVSGQANLEQMMPYVGSNSSVLNVFINDNQNQTYNGFGAAGGQCYYYFTGQYQV